MPRRKSKKAKRQKQERSSLESDNADAFETSIEEDLRQQRLRQDARKPKEPAEQQVAPTIDLEAEGSVLVESCPTRRQDVILRGMATTPAEKLTRLPALSFAFLQNESPLLSARQKDRIRNIWHSKYLLENTLVNPRASMLYKKKLKWRNHALPDGMNAPVDMTCKSYLHASARTFDVATLEEDGLPTITTTIQGGFGVFTASYGRHDNFHTLRGLPVYSVRMHKGSGRCGTVVMSNDRYSLYKFQCYPLPDATSYFDVMLQEPVTDFSFGTDLVLFACPRYFGRTTLNPIFLTLEDGREGCLRSLNVENFPQSDALRVEMSCHKEKYVAFGHRNGQVSLLDLRQSMCCSILQYSMGVSSSSPLLGSATDLQFLSNQRLLVKRSFGSVQLHDLRQVSSSSTSNHHHSSKKSLSVVQNFDVPSNILSTASATCNGLAVDPSCQQTLMTPYINSDREPCLGFWSLKSGVFVGNKVLAKNREQDTFFVELCQTTTASFSPNFETNKTDPPQFGVWLKCGRFAKQKLGYGKAGSLHHLSFPGGID